jgi:hypothetical protein
MSSEREASIKLKLVGRGFVAGLRTLEEGTKRSAKMMAGSFGVVSKAIHANLREATTQALRLGSVIERSTKRARFSGLLEDLRQIESRSLALGQKIRRGMSSLGMTAMGMKGSNFNVLPPGGAQQAPGNFAMGGAMFIANLASAAVQKAVGKVVELGHDAYGVGEQARQLSVSARGAGQAYLDPKILEAEFYNVAKKVKGTTADEAGDAAQKFYALTGDLDTVRASLETFAVVARATGGKMGEVAESAASISQQFKITKKEDMQQVFATLAYQGKAGAIELKDLAHGLQRLAAAGAGFGMTGVGGVSKLGGLVQLARRGTGSADQAFTAVEDLFAELGAKSKQIQAAGVKVYEGKGPNKRQRDPTEIIIDLISKVGKGNVQQRMEKLQSFLGMQGIRAVKSLIPIYDRAAASATGKGGQPATAQERREAGIAALRAEMDSAINVAGSWSDVMSDAAKMQESDGAKMTAAWQQLQQQVAINVLPKLSAFVDALTKSPDAINGFTQGIILMGEGMAKLLRLLGIETTPGESKGSSSYLADSEKALKDKQERDKYGSFGAAGAEKLKNVELDRKAREAGAGNVELGRDILAQQTEQNVARNLLPPALRKKPDAIPTVAGALAPPANPTMPLWQAMTPAGAPGPAGAGKPLEIARMPNAPLNVVITEDRTKRGDGRAAPLPGHLARE